MRDDLLNALRRNLASAESAGQTDRVKALRKRIKEHEGEVIDVDQLAGMTKADLLELAAKHDVDGRSGMNKDELITALSEAQEEGE